MTDLNKLNTFLGEMTDLNKLNTFLGESNAIEGIHGAATRAELDAARHFLGLPTVTVDDLNAAQMVFAPRRPLRDRPGMDVRVGDYVAPPGGPEIVTRLSEILDIAHKGNDPWQLHITFETLHPYLDGNGRTGRLLWAWHMRRLGRDPFVLPFLHRFYYQTLEHVGR